MAGVNVRAAVEHLMQSRSQDFVLGGSAAGQGRVRRGDVTMSPLPPPQLVAQVSILTRRLAQAPLLQLTDEQKKWHPVELAS